VVRADRFVPWGLFLLAAAFRLVALGARPLHHDEGTNAIFLLRLLDEGSYRYDPANYHGPLPYYMSGLALAALGRTNEALRIVPAILGAGMAPLAWILRRELGRAGAVAAGILLALSPALVYYSRDNIHETYFVFFTMLSVVAAVRGRSSPRPGWFLLSGLSAGAMAATKETAPLAIGTLLLGGMIAGPFGLGRPRSSHVLIAIIGALVLAGAFYTDFGADPSALLSPIESIRQWGGRALRPEGHGKPWFYYLKLMSLEEPALLPTAFCGAAVALRRRLRSGIALAVWGGATLIAYSSIPYKTPWLVLNIILPIALLSGVAFGAGLRGPVRPRRATVFLLSACAAAAAMRAVDLSLVRYDDDRASPLVYVQTSREALWLVQRIQAYAEARPERTALSVQILSPDYLPLNWYLRDFENVAYFGHPIERPGGAVVIARSDAADSVAARLGPGYTREEYALRPGVRLCLFLRGPGAGL
jgi:uncharacterized protein (TIGR03663 family)